MTDFINYCLDFYGKGGLYDIGATAEDIKTALKIRLAIRADLPFDGDSIDRELVRDIILAAKN